MSNANEAGPTLGECLDHHNFLIFGEPVEPIDAGTSALASEIARRWNAHPDLLAACEAALPWLDLVGNYVGNGVESDPTRCGVKVGPMGRCDVRYALWQAIAKARGAS